MLEMNSNQAVVLGASMAGLLAARVLSERFERVVVIERDVLPPPGEHRRGVPHGRHLHGLHPRGREILEELFPGFTASLTASGAVSGDILGDSRWQLSGRQLRKAQIGLPGLLASRPFLEGHIRAMVQALPGVRFLEDCSVSGLTVTEDKQTVTGVQVRGPGGGAPTQVPGDLVVDATGRGSRTPVWLAELGYQSPEQERVEVGLGYATRTYRLRPGAMDGDQLILTAGTPANPRAGFLAATEGGRHMLTIAGMCGNYPPADPAGFGAFVAGLPTADIAAAIAGAEPLDDPVPFRFPASVRHRYERLTSFPAGLLVIGDAVLLVQPGLRAGHDRGRDRGHDLARAAGPPRGARRPPLLPRHRRRDRCGLGHRCRRRPGVPPGTRQTLRKGAAGQRLHAAAARGCRPRHGASGSAGPGHRPEGPPRRAAPPGPRAAGAARQPGQPQASRPGPRRPGTGRHPSRAPDAAHAVTGKAQASGPARCLAPPARDGRCAERQAALAPRNELANRPPKRSCARHDRAPRLMYGPDHGNPAFKMCI